MCPPLVLDCLLGMSRGVVDTSCLLCEFPAIVFGYVEQTYMCLSQITRYIRANRLCSRRGIRSGAGTREWNWQQQSFLCVCTAAVIQLTVYSSASRNTDVGCRCDSKAGGSCVSQARVLTRGWELAAAKFFRTRTYGV